MRDFSPKFGIFKPTFSDEKIFDNFSTVKNLRFVASPDHNLPSCYNVTASESNRNSFESNRICYQPNRLPLVSSPFLRGTATSVYNYCKLTAGLDDNVSVWLPGLEII